MCETVASALPSATEEGTKEGSEELGNWKVMKGVKMKMYTDGQN
jgi:hypothetical protein